MFKVIRWVLAGLIGLVSYIVYRENKKIDAEIEAFRKQTKDFEAQHEQNMKHLIEIDQASRPTEEQTQRINQMFENWKDFLREQGETEMLEEYERFEKELEEAI